MKKVITLVLMILLSLSICGCGDVSDFGVDITSSERYSQDEINSAVDSVKNYFWKEFDGCTLYAIGYNDSESESVREDNIYRYQRSFEPKTVTDALELQVTYYEGQNSDKTRPLVTETFTMVKLDNGGWEVGGHGRI